MRRIKDILAEIGIVIALEQKAEQDKWLQEEEDRVRLEKLLKEQKKRNSFSFKLGSWVIFALFLGGVWFLFLDPTIGITVIIVALGVGYLRNRQPTLTPRDQLLLKQEEERKKQEEKIAKVEARRKGFRTLLLSLLLAIVLVLVLIGIDPNFR